MSILIAFLLKYLVYLFLFAKYIMLKTYFLTPQEKQKIWRQKQIFTYYGSGRPLFNTNTENYHIRKHYDVRHYFTSQNEIHKKYPYYDFHNTNFAE